MRVQNSRPRLVHANRHNFGGTTPRLEQADRGWSDDQRDLLEPELLRGTVDGDERARREDAEEDARVFHLAIEQENEDRERDVEDERSSLCGEYEHVTPCRAWNSWTECTWPTREGGTTTTTSYVIGSYATRDVV